MMTALSQAREDARFRIHNYVRELSAGEGDDQDSRGLFAIAWEHRQLAICRLLQDKTGSFDDVMLTSGVVAPGWEKLRPRFEELAAKDAKK